MHAESMDAPFGWQKETNYQNVQFFILQRMAVDHITRSIVAKITVLYVFVRPNVDIYKYIYYCCSKTRIPKSKDINTEKEVTHSNNNVHKNGIQKHFAT